MSIATFLRQAAGRIQTWVAAIRLNDPTADRVAVIGAVGRRSRASVLAPLVLFSALVFAAGPVGAHTKSVGFTVAPSGGGNGTVTVYYGSYHSVAPTAEGVFELNSTTGGPSFSGAADTTYATKPPALIDGANNYLSTAGGTCTSGGVFIWMSRTFTNVPAGTYEIRLTGSFTAVWQPCADINPRTVTLDYDPPGLDSIVRQNPSQQLTNADSVTFRVTFDDDVANVSANDFVVSGGSTASVTGVTAVNGSTYDITVSGGDLANFIGTVGLDLAPGQDIVDLSGNALPSGEPATDETYTLDNQAPGVAISGVPASTNGPFTATFTFDETVSGFDAGDITVGNGSLSGFMQTGPNTYTALVTPTATGTVTIDVPAGGASDAAGNGNAAAAQATSQYDATPPGVAISGVPAQSNAPFTATFTFDEPVVGFGAGDIAVGNGSASSFVQTGPTTYTALITPASDGTVTVDVPAGAAQDTAGNASTAAAQATSQYDGTGPAVAISGVPAVASGPFPATFTFDETVTGFDVADIVIGNGAASGFVQTGPMTYTALITPTADGTVTIDVPAGAAQDAFGNASTAAAQVTTQFDATPPGVAISGVPANANGPFTTTFTFDEVVSGFDAGDIVVGNGTPSNLVQTGPTTYTALITPAAEGPVTIDVPPGAAQDSAGNASTAAAQASTSYDTTAPTVDITGVPGQSDGPFTATFTFSEDVTGFAISDLGITNGTASGFVMVSASTYTALITPTAQGQVTIDVPAGAAQDAAGNANIAGQAVSNYIDRAYTAERTKRVIRNFMSRRADQITAADPDLVWRLQRNRGASGASGPVGFTGRGTEENVEIAFSTSLRQVMSASSYHKAVNAKDGMQNLMALGYQQMMKPQAEYGFDIWVQGKISRIDTDTSETDLGLLYVAADYRFSQDVVVGIMSQFDWASENDDRNGASAEGFGWMIGPYIVGRIHQNFLFEGRFAAGRADNKVSPFNTYEDDFETERWLARARLTGDFHYGEWNFEPHIGIIYFEEKQKAYRDSFGTFIAGQDVTLGRLTFGPKISRRFIASDGKTIIAPHIGLQAIWDFDKAETVDVATGLGSGSSDGVRGRIEGGISVYSEDGISFTGRFAYDGIGADDLDAYSASGRLRFKY